MRKTFTLRRAVLAALIAAFAPGAQMTLAQCPAAVPVRGGALPGPLPLFPADNWWNTDISAAPVDANSTNFINFVGAGRALHPDFGGEETPGSIPIYGMPYAVVDASQPKMAVTFAYWDESDGVDPVTGQGIPFYPIPPQAATQPHWVEGGSPGNVDERADGDRHLILVDCTNRYLYELYNVWHDGTKWRAGSGAFFDMKTNHRRPETWTSADAAGLAIFPGLVRYDEAWNPAIADIGHAFRVTVRATNGYVFPASHRAGSTAGALPMGARLRLRPLVNGVDPVNRTSNPNVQKIFRAMQKYGLIVADNGSDMYVTGTFDTRWNNDILNPAFSLLRASDFDVVQLGWKPAVAAPALASLAIDPGKLYAGASAEGTVTMTASAASPITVSLASASPAVTVPASVVVPAGALDARFAVTASQVVAVTVASVTATYAGVTKSAGLQVNPAPYTLQAPVISPASVVGGGTATGTITIGAPAPAGGATVALRSGSTLAQVPAQVTISAGATSVQFPIPTRATRRDASVTLIATHGTAASRVTFKVLAR
ncbi:MAG: hypothetical protein U1F54_20635 [Burkholderiales bacterium]